MAPATTEARRIGLGAGKRAVVERECQRHCLHRGWHVWAVNVRSTHVHVVATATGYSGKTVRDQLKANGTRGLRESWPRFCDRPVWTAGGDWSCVNSEDELQPVCAYVRDAQDYRRADRPSAAGESAAGRSAAGR